MNTIKIAFIFLISIQFTFCKSNQSLPDFLKARWKGNSVCELFKENNNIRVLKCTFSPNVGNERHYHGPHFGYTLAGSKFRYTSGVHN